MKQREIKFRAWHKKKKKWYFLPIKIFTLGYSNEMALCETFGFDGNTSKTDNSSWENDKPEDYILMQLIGLKDKNRKEIYEGDILTSVDGGYEGEVFWDEEEMCFMCGSKEGASTNLAKEDIFYEAKVKITGNIYENPELLGEK